MGYFIALSQFALLIMGIYTRDGFMFFVGLIGSLFISLIFLAPYLSNRSPKKKRQQKEKLIEDEYERMIKGSEANKDQ